MLVPAAATTAHSLAILSEYTHTLDSLPLDLSRNFADLRELDAVLSSSMAVLTTKIIGLTEMIESNVGTKEDRLWLLVDIAEEAHRLKLGGEDKIRVACHAADGLRGHQAHMRELLRHIPDPDYDTLADRLGRKTVFPHVSRHQYLPAGGTEGGRRQRRGAFLTGAAVEASPAKRKRAAPREDELEVPKSPRKTERTVDAPRPRNNGRVKRTERAASPADSVLSVASHLPSLAHPPAPTHASHSRQSGHARVPSVSSNKRSRTTNGMPDAMSVHLDARKDSYNAPPSSSSAHPSLPAPFANGSINGYPGSGVLPVRADDSTRGWQPGQLEGPGMPVARPFPVAPVHEQGDADVATGTEAEGDADDGRTYCICGGVSYGAMIACDDKHCKLEWFHLPCIGLTTPPDGLWYCPDCFEKRNSRRPARGGKKKSGGTRAGARKASD